MAKKIRRGWYTRVPSGSKTRSKMMLNVTLAFLANLQGFILILVRIIFEQDLGLQNHNPIKD